MLDGFDLGVGVLHLFLVRTEAERKAALRSIGPVWDGNEVWLLAGGGTLYFAFPLLYASAFSGFYLPLMIVLWLLVLRGVSLELRNHIDVGVWRALLDGVFGLSSALLTIFFGAALANVLRGVPLQADGYFFLPLWTNWQPGAAPGILDWYTVIGGLVAFVALTLHGALWLTHQNLWRSGAARAQRCYATLVHRLSRSPWSACSPPSPCAPPASTTTSIPRSPSLIPAGVVASLAGVWFWNRKGEPVKAFLASCLYLFFMLAGACWGVYPDAAARHHRRRPRHHAHPRDLRPAHAGRGPGLVDLRHGPGHRLRRLRLSRFKGKVGAAAHGH